MFAPSIDSAVVISKQFYTFNPHVVVYHNTIQLTNFVGIEMSQSHSHENHQNIRKKLAQISDNLANYSFFHRKLEIEFHFSLATLLQTHLIALLLCNVLDVKHMYYLFAA